MIPFTFTILYELEAYEALQEIRPILPFAHGLRYEYDFGEGWSKGAGEMPLPQQ